MDEKILSTQEKLVTRCPAMHSDCTAISEVVTDDMPDLAEQAYYCAECEKTYVVIYHPIYRKWVNTDG